MVIYVCQTFVATLLLLGLAQGACKYICRVTGTRSTSTWLFMVLFTHLHRNSSLEYPKDVEVLPNEWVQFNCTITPCNYTVSWFIAGISHAIRNNDSVPGLVIRRTASMCTSNQETHFFEVQATGALNNSAFYCAANQGFQITSTCRCGADGRCFSKPALLRGKPV